MIVSIYNVIKIHCAYSNSKQDTPLSINPTIIIIYQSPRFNASTERLLVAKFLIYQNEKIKSLDKYSRERTELKLSVHRDKIVSRKDWLEEI